MMAACGGKCCAVRHLARIAGGHCPGWSGGPGRRQRVIALTADDTASAPSTRSTRHARRGGGKHPAAVIAVGVPL